MSTPTPSSSPWAATPSTPLGSSHISRTLFQNGSEDFQESPVGSPYRPQGTPGGQRNGASYAYGAEEDYGEADAGSIAGQLTLDNDLHIGRSRLTLSPRMTAGSLAVNAASSLFTTDMFDSYPTEATTTPFSTTNSAVSTPNPNRTPNYAAYTPATPSGGSLIASNSLPGLSNYASTSPSALSPFVPAIYPTRNQPLAPYIVRPSPLPKTVTVHTDRSLAYLDSGNALRPSLRSKMDEIMSENRVRITVRRPATSVPPGGISGSGPGLGTIPPTDHDVERQAQVEIEIAGGSDRVEIARLNVLAALDELSGLHVEIVNLEPGQPNMFHNIIAGPKRQMLKNIMRRSKTSVYLPSPFVVQNIDVISEPAGMVVSGSAEGVAEASRMLRELAEAKV